MRRLLIAAVLCAAWAAPIAAQHPAAPAAKTTTYVLTQEQVATLYAAMVAADFWLQVRAMGAGNTIDAKGFELQRRDLHDLSVEMGRQAQAAAKPADPAPAPAPTPTPEPTP